jgi:hypothetical protein
MKTRTSNAISGTFRLKANRKADLAAGASLSEATREDPMRSEPERAWRRVRTISTEFCRVPNAGDLPGETPTVFELAMNRKAANARLQASRVDTPRGRHRIRCDIAAACDWHASPRPRAKSSRPSVLLFAVIVFVETVRKCLWLRLQTVFRTEARRVLLARPTSGTARFVTRDRSLEEINDPFCADDHLPSCRRRDRQNNDAGQQGDREQDPILLEIGKGD